MTKADKLREKLRATRNRMTRAEAIEIVGNPGGLSNMLKTGELRTETIENVSWIILDPDYAKQRKTQQTLPVKRKKSKRAGGKKKHKAPRKAAISMKDIVAKHIPENRTEALARIALQNLIASTEGLTATVRDQVEGIENNPSLRAQIEASERAAQMARLV